MQSAIACIRVKISNESRRERDEKKLDRDFHFESEKRSFSVDCITENHCTEEKEEECLSTYWPI